MAHDVLSDAHRPSRPSRRSVCRALSFSCMVLLALLGAAWSLQSRLLQELASIWIIEERPRQADAIVVLGGSVDVRVTKAAELWRQGFAPLNLIAKTRSAAGEAEPGELTHARSLLSGLGVPYSAVRAFGHDVVNTYEEACALRDWVALNRAHRVLIPTEIFYTRRTHWVMTKVLDQTGADVIVQSIMPRGHDRDTWWQQGATSFRLEIAKYLYYRLRY